MEQVNIITIKSNVELSEPLLDKVYGKVKRLAQSNKTSSVSRVMGYPVTIRQFDSSITATIRNKD